MSLPVSGPASRMRSISFGTGGQGAVRGIWPIRCSHGRFWLGHVRWPIPCRRTFAYTSSSSRIKRVERRLSNSSVDRYATTQSHCTSTFTRNTFPTSKMSICIVTRIDVENAVTVYRNMRGYCIGTSVPVREVCAESILAPSVLERLDD